MNLKRNFYLDEKLRPFIHLLFLVLSLGLSTLLGFGFQSYGLHETNIVVVYIFSVLLISHFTTSYFYGIVSSVISLLLFNWFFTQPYFTLKVDDLTYLVTFAIMTLIAILTSTLTTKAKQAALLAQERENESHILYQMMNRLTKAQNSEEMGIIIATSVADILDESLSFSYLNEKAQIEWTLDYQRKSNQIQILSNAKENLQLTNFPFTSSSNPCVVTENHHHFLISNQKEVLAILSFSNAVGQRISATQKRTIYSMMESAALAIDHLRSSEAQIRSREEAIQERYRGNLLRSISHDIRTPLSGIMGTSEMLMNTLSEGGEGYAFAKDIYEDALWLHGMVENILNLTRLQEGQLLLHKQPEAIEEVIGAALMLIGKRFPQRMINVDIPSNVIIVPMDARLISQVIVNLLENAIKYTPAEQPIYITVEIKETGVETTVYDKGCGIAPEDLPHIFKMFYTTMEGSGPLLKRGVGLGLAICQSIVEAHGGRIEAHNRKEGGAQFTFTLPLGEDK